MTGRHRRTRTATARGALVATVPALGLVGAVGALTGAETDVTPSAFAAGPEASADVPAPLEPAAAARPAVTGAAAQAATAADHAGRLQVDQERRALADVVSDVRADDQDREAAAAAQGQEELDAFRRDLAREQQAESEAEPEPETGTRDDPAPADRGEDGGADRCDTSGTPMFSGPADPDEIVGRDCGLVGLFGQERSLDPWVDGQLLSTLER